jgi:hypothetical protein
MKSKRKFFIILIGILIVFLVGYFSIVKKESPPPIEKGALKVVDINPPSGKNKALHPTTGIVFSFDDPIILSSVGVVVDPDIQLVTELARGDNKSLIVRPKEAWTFGVNYRIVIRKGIASTNNKELKEDVFYEIEFEYPEDIMSY